MELFICPGRVQHEKAHHPDQGRPTVAAACICISSSCRKHYAQDVDLSSSLSASSILCRPFAGINSSLADANSTPPPVFLIRLSRPRLVRPLSPSSMSDSPVLLGADATSSRASSATTFWGWGAECRDFRLSLRCWKACFGFTDTTTPLAHAAAAIRGARLQSLVLPPRRPALVWWWDAGATQESEIEL